MVKMLIMAAIYVPKQREMPNKAMQIDAVRAVRLHEWSCRPFYHANGHRIQRD